jgi:hypothetical protein
VSSSETTPEDIETAPARQESEPGMGETMARIRQRLGEGFYDQPLVMDRLAVRLLFHLRPPQALR